MTKEQINIAIAEACGWKGHPFCTDMMGNPFPGWDIPPDYCNDLNAMHEAEATLNYEQGEQFEDELYDICYKENCHKEYPLPFRFAVAHATAQQRAEAFLKTIGKWKEQIISPKRKTFNIRTKIKVNIEAESLQEAEDMFFNATISFQNKQGKELQWELMDSQIEEV